MGEEAGWDVGGWDECEEGGWDAKKERVHEVLAALL